MMMGSIDNTDLFQFEVSLALSLIITTHPPGKVEMQLQIGQIRQVYRKVSKQVSMQVSKLVCK